MELKESKKPEVIQKLSDMPGRMSTTTDMWTSLSGRGYMVVTGYFIDHSWEFVSVILAFERIVYPHTAARLAEALLSALDMMNVTSKFWVLTADNATTNPSMFKIIMDDINKRESSPPLNSNMLNRCIGHILAIAINEATSKCKLIDSSIGQLREISKKVKDSLKLTEGLQMVCRDLNEKYMELKLDVVTHWNSTWDMLDHALQMRGPLSELLRRIEGHHLGFTGFSIAPGTRLSEPIGDQVWSAASDFVSFLRKFKDATDLMSGSTYPTLSIMIPVFRILMRHVKLSMEKPVMMFNNKHTVEFASVVLNKLSAYR